MLAFGYAGETKIDTEDDMEDNKKDEEEKWKWSIESEISAMETNVCQRIWTIIRKLPAVFQQHAHHRVIRLGDLVSKLLPRHAYLWG